METTDYYENEVKFKHPEIQEEWVERVVANPHHTEIQPDGRIRYYGFILEADKWLRVIVEGGQVHNRFFDHHQLKQWGRP